MLVTGIEERYQVTATPLSPAAGNVPQKFLDILKKSAKDEEMQVYTISVWETPGDGAPARRATDSLGTALVIVEFGDAKVAAWNKPPAEITAQQDEFEELVLRAVERVGDD